MCGYKKRKTRHCNRRHKNRRRQKGGNNFGVELLKWYGKNMFLPALGKQLIKQVQ